MKNEFKNRSWIIMEPDMFESQAYRDLSGKNAVTVLLRFIQKAHRKRTKGKKGLKRMVITNNGELIFTYAEAKALGIGGRTFYRVVRELVEDKGFVDLAEPGNWYEKEPAKYAISERWRRYGTDDYICVEIPREHPPGKNPRDRYGKR